MHEVSRENDAASRPAYEANVYIGWDPQTEQYVCVWLDTCGGISTQSIGRATRDGDAIPFVFTDRDGGGGTFHTTFAYQRAADTWTWRTDAVEQGPARPFARVTLTRR